MKQALKSIEMNKLLQAQGAEKVCRRNDHHFVLTIHILLRAALVGMAFCSPHLLTKLCASVKLLFSVWLPSLWEPKVAFAVCNFIIVFLVRQSRPPTPDIYQEYYAAMQGHCSQSVASESVKVAAEAEMVEKAEDEEKSEPYVESSTSVEEIDEIVVVKEEEEEACEEEEEDGAVAEGEEGWTVEELNRRVEEFIAKFNMQRRMEARMLICCH